VVVVTALDPPTVEVHCHGGLAAVAMVRDSLVAAGGERGEWPKPEGLTRSRAEAWADLLRAATGRTAAILLDQAQGAFDRECERLASLVDSDPEAVRRRMEQLVGRSPALVEGAVVVLAGRPNVGKSRLLNALAGYERSIVSEEAGTTRDLVRTATAMGGWPVELVDAAGDRAESEVVDRVEAEGVRRAGMARRDAAAVVLVLDRSEPLQATDHRLMAALPDAIRVGNKSDRPGAWEGRDLGALEVSALAGVGLDGLIGAITARIEPQPIAPGEAVVVREWQRDRLRAADAAIGAGRADDAAEILRGASRETSVPAQSPEVWE
jgi:tRNA modification GTPase